MRKKFWIKTKKIILWLLFVGSCIYSTIEPLYTPTAIVVNVDQHFFPEIIAHKALMTDDFPGNSLSSIKQSLLSTVDGIEVDVRMSKDGVLFLYHGNTLEEYTDHTGIPENYAWAHLCEVKYKNMEEGLVSLDDFLSLVGTQKVIFLDIKSNDKMSIQMPHTIVDAIKKHHLQGHVFVESFNPFTLAVIRLYSRDIMLMYDFVDDNTALGEGSQEQFNKISWVLKQHWVQKQIRRIIRPDVLGPRFNLNPLVLQDLVLHGYPIISWTVDDPNIAKQLYVSNIKGLQSNKPKLIESILLRTNRKLLDAGGASAVVDKIITVLNIEDIQESIKTAKKEGKNINIGGRRHSMGGQTLSDQGIFLNMLNFNKITYNADTKTVTAQAGATWQKVQTILSMQDRSIQVMQSDNIFTVGGSISANVHGWQVKAPPIASTIVNMTVITCDGEIRKISPVVEPELFKAVIGGYGMFAIILDAELMTTSNSDVKFQAFFTEIKDFNALFEEKITKNNKVELAYARLSIDEDNLFNEVGLFWHETVKTTSQNREIKPEKLIALKRTIFRLSEYYNFAKRIRWQAEKSYSNILVKNQEYLSRNDAMNTDIHIIWPLYGSNKDVLHEYFIPKDTIYPFIQALKNKIIKHQFNTLNVTIREVEKDNISLLPYAKKDVFSVVCLFSQERTLEDEEKMKRFTESIIDEAIQVGGTFYLTYRPHYTASQLLKAYPEIKDWITMKRKYDPQMILKSQFFEYITTLLNNESQIGL